MLVKVCGITNLEAAKAVSESADFIGFVFAPSSRYIEPLEAKKIADQLPTSIQKVGVFVNESKANIENIAHQVGLDYIQLHGDESAEFAKDLSLPVIKALRINDQFTAHLKCFPADYFIVDSPGQKYAGGSGESFDWQQLTDLEVDLSNVFLAGGLNKNNVSQAIKIVKPCGVDVSSGVETNGKKDLFKIKEFVKQAKERNHKHEII